MSETENLYKAIADNDSEKIQTLLQGDTSLLSSVDETPPPLHFAIYHNHLKIVEALLDCGADIEQRDKDRNATPLIYAVIYGRDGIIRTLIARGANLESKGNSGTILQIAQKGAAGGFDEFGDEVASREDFARIASILRELGAEEG